MNLFTNIFTDYKSQLTACQTENARITHDLDDYKLRLEICQGENKRLTTELNDCNLRLHVSEGKNKQFLIEWEAYQREKDEMREMKALINLNNKECEDREGLLTDMKILRGENKKLNEDLIELRRVIINRKKSK